MATDRPFVSTARSLGVIGVTAIAAGASWALFTNAGISDPLAGILIRVGAVLGAFAIILPSIRKPSTKTLLIVAAATTVIMVKPGLVWAGIVGLVIWRLGRRDSNLAGRHD